MATPKKLPSGNWNVRVFSHMEDGKRKYVSFTASTRQEVTRMAALFQLNKNIEDHPQDMTVGLALSKYIDSRTNRLSPSTIKEYNNSLKYYKPLEDKRISALTDDILDSFVEDLCEGLNPKTVRNIYTLLMSAISKYSNRKFKVYLPESQKVERHIPTDADVNNLLRHANPTLKKAILLAGIGTLRRGEICALTYGDILHDFNAVFIHSDMVLGIDGWVIKSIAKTPASKRKVVLPKSVIEMLGDGEPTERIIKCSPSTITCQFNALRNKLGLECRFHDLRHYAASTLHALNIPDTYVQERGGWGSDRVLKDVYQNVLDDKKVHFTTVANEYFEKNISIQDKQDKTG